MAPVEAILDRVASRITVTSDGRRPAVECALWICACLSREDAPTWLIFDEPDETLRWCRVPDGSKASDIVDARVTAGGHTDPGTILAWLRGDEADPWADGHGWGDAEVIRGLGA